ncbi:MAG TPA: PilZ domain-containing protein [Vicinamibacterales bacterium]|jgi:PilZ domain|nr:PilZ domain-containing protein [Vicinamibacterales bacterium]
MPDAVVISAEALMQELVERLRLEGVEGDLRTFPDSEPIPALQAIIQAPPDLIVLERLFAATPRGAALINRIKTDPALGTCEVRVLSHSGDYARVVVAPTQPAAALAGSGHAHGGSEAATAPNMDWHGTRRGQRYHVRPGIEIQFDGNPATIIDLSGYGAQVVSPTVLRPNQKVRISLPSEEFVMRFRGTIVWAQFELTRIPQYRAGVEFTDADARALDLFCMKNKQ